MPASTSESDAAFAAAFPTDPLSPAVLAEDGRGPVALLNVARDQAARTAESLDQVDAADAGLTRVQKLVERLSDIAVVALDRHLHPANRAVLQRQVDLVLREIDAVSEETTFEEALLHDGAHSDAAGDVNGRPRTPFRAIGTTLLGIDGLAVRSSDQALAAAGALDLATGRLERTAGRLGASSARLQRELRGVTSPTTTATGQAAFSSPTAALSAAMVLREHLARSPEQAVQAQAGLDVARVRWLLESAPE